MSHDGESIQPYLENELSSKQIVPFLKNQDIPLTEGLITDVVDDPNDEIEINVVSTEPFNKDEDDLIMKNVLKHGQKWEVIARFVRGRTPTMIKNRFNSCFKKKMN